MVMRGCHVLMLLLAAGLVFAGDAPEPWGPEHTTPEMNAKVKGAIDVLARGSDGVKPTFGKALIIGPALWARLSKADPVLSTFGTGSKAEVSAGRTMEARTYRGQEVAKFLASNAVKSLGKQFQTGRIRAATSAERHVFYDTIPYEITNEPQAVAETDGDVLLVDFARDTAFWLDILSDSAYKP
jgi:hypothetical protein